MKASAWAYVYGHGNRHGHRHGHGHGHGHVYRRAQKQNMCVDMVFTGAAEPLGQLRHIAHPRGPGCWLYGHAYKYAYRQVCGRAHRHAYGPLRVRVCGHEYGHAVGGADVAPVERSAAQCPLPISGKFSAHADGERRGLDRVGGWHRKGLGETHL